MTAAPEDRILRALGFLLGCAFLFAAGVGFIVATVLKVWFG